MTDDEAARKGQDLIVRTHRAVASVFRRWLDVLPLVDHPSAANWEAFPEFPEPAEVPGRDTRPPHWGGLPYVDLADVWRTGAVELPRAIDMLIAPPDRPHTTAERSARTEGEPYGLSVTLAEIRLHWYGGALLVAEFGTYADFALRLMRPSNGASHLQDSWLPAGHPFALPRRARASDDQRCRGVAQAWRAIGAADAPTTDRLARDLVTIEFVARRGARLIETLADVDHRNADWPDLADVRRLFHDLELTMNECALRCTHMGAELIPLMFA